MVSLLEPSPAFRPHWRTLGGRRSVFICSCAVFLPRVFNATSALFFAIINWVKVPYYLYAQLFDFQQMRGLIWLLPLLPLGVWGGKWAADKISQKSFERVIVALLAVTALLLIFS